MQVSRWDVFNEYTQHMFLLRNKRLSYFHIHIGINKANSDFLIKKTLVLVLTGCVSSVGYFHEYLKQMD